jgi:hypothetical protein
MNQDAPEHYQELEDKLMDVLWSLRYTLPQSDAKEIRSFVDRNDFKVAFETLACVLSEDDTAVTSDDLLKLKWLGTSMRLADALGMINNLRIEFNG